jgi:hypothetical protein
MTLRAIGRGIGSGTFGLTGVALANADHPMTWPVIRAIDKLIDRAVDRKAAVRAE